MSFGMQGLHVLRHAESGLTRQARQARGEFWGRFPSRGLKILGFQDWKYWMIGKTARIGGLEARYLTRRGARRILLLFFLQDVIRSPLLAVHPRRENLDVFFNLLLPLLPLLLRAAAW